MTIYQFNREEQQVYNRITKGLNDNICRITIRSSYSENYLFLLYLAALSENKNGFQYNPLRIMLNKTSSSTIITLDYIFSPYLMESKRIAFKNAILEYECRDADTFHIIKHVYDKMVMSITYQDTGSMAYTSWGVLVEKKGVCEGISLAFSEIMRFHNISCGIVNGKADRDDLRNMSHAWNIIQIGNETYHVDVTWAINSYLSSGIICYDYFCVTDIDIKKDHKWEQSWYPVCNSTQYNYFVKMNRLAENVNQVDKVITSQILSNQSVLSIKLSTRQHMKISENDIIDIICKRMQQNMNSNQLQLTWVKNEKMRTFYYIIPATKEGKDYERKQKKKILIGLNSDAEIKRDIESRVKIIILTSLSDRSILSALRQTYHIGIWNIKYGRASKAELSTLSEYAEIVTFLPNWLNGSRHELDYLKGCIHNSIKLADDNGYKSISFFAGRNSFPQYPVDNVSHIIINTCGNALKETHSITRIIICCENEEIEKRYTLNLRAYQKN